VPRTIPATLGIFSAAVLYFAVTVAAEGGVAAYFAHPPLDVLALAYLGLAVSGLFTQASLSRGVREDRGNRWVVVALIGVSLVGAVVPPYTDRLDVFSFGGEGVRWLGVVLFAAGGVLRMVPVFVLGHRFSGLVAIQPGHRLMTAGIYATIRHPSYLGLLVCTLGWGLAFRSDIGVLLAVLSLPPVLARIRAEEAMLAQEFGADYAAYRARTARLVPGVY
jgi:protein-S-isoprenylcysteine O-methyltransferase Ste14